MEQNHWLDYLSAVGAIATPVLILFLTSVGWKLRQSVERRNELEDKLREDRIHTYNQILEPFIIILMPDAAWEQDPKNKNKNKGDLATAKMLSLEYRNYGFKLALVGSDSVVEAYNNLMQFFFAQGGNSIPSRTHIKQMLELLGTFLLEIRKSMGNETTKLTNWQMLEWFFKEARELSGGGA